MDDFGQSNLGKETNDSHNPFYKNGKYHQDR